MPADSLKKALKAQAVASRTYALGQTMPARTSAIPCTARSTEATIFQKVKDAVNDTKGQVLLYDGNLAAHALFSPPAQAKQKTLGMFSPAPFLIW